MNGTENTTSPQSLRFEWLDALRGGFLLAMASYHFMWDLANFGYLDPEFPSTGWPRIYARIIASTFLFLAGFSLVLAHGNGIRWRSFARRFGKILAAAIAVTIATYFAIPQGFIFFGILHAIATASLIGLLFLRVPAPLTAIVAAGIIAAPLYMRSGFFDSWWFWWIGLSIKTHVSFDYVPLLPWLAAFLFGMAACKTRTVQDRLRQNAQRKTITKDWKTPFAFLGRHSLVFYLVHQPVLISIIYVFSLLVPAPEVDPAVKYIGVCERSCKANQTVEFCQRFCGCTLDALQQQKLLAPFQSGAISVADSRIKEVAIECTTISQ